VLVNDKDLQLKMNVGNFIDDSDYLIDNYFVYSFVISGINVEIRKFIQYLNSILEFPFFRHRFTSGTLPVRDPYLQKVIIDFNLERMNENQKGIEKYLKNYDNNKPLYFLQIKTRMPIHTEMYTKLKGVLNYNIRIRQQKHVTYDTVNNFQTRTSMFQQKRLFELGFMVNIDNEKTPFIYLIPKTYYSSNEAVRTDTGSFVGMKEFWDIEKTSHTETQTIRIHDFELTKMSFNENKYYVVGDPIYGEIPIYKSTCNSDVVYYVDTIKSNYYGFRTNIDVYSKLVEGYYEAVDSICNGNTTCKTSIYTRMSTIIGDLLIMLTFNMFNYIKPNYRFDGIDPTCLTTYHPIYKTFLIDKKYVQNFEQRVFYHIVYENMKYYSFLFFREYCYWTLKGVSHVNVR